MASSFWLDHLVIIVDDLQTATTDYRALGFTIQFGGEYTDGLSHNTLISFQYGSYLELYALKKRSQIRLMRLRALGLLAYTRNRSPVARRFIHSVALGEGLADYTLGTDDLGTLVANSRQHQRLVAPSGSPCAPRQAAWLRSALWGVFVPCFPGILLSFFVCRGRS